MIKDKTNHFNCSFKASYNSSSGIHYEKFEGKIDVCSPRKNEFMIKFKDLTDHFRMKHYIKLTRSSEIPGCSVIISVIILKSDKFFSDQQALREVKHISMSLPLLGELAKGLRIPDNITTELNIFDPKADIETFLELKFNKEIDIKDNRFLTECNLMPFEKVPLDYSTLDALHRNKTAVLFGVPLEKRKKGYMVYPKGGIECKNQDDIKAQDGLLTEMISTAGKALFEGKSLVALSLPVRVFSPMCSTERLPDSWSAGPVYLKRAAMTDDKRERFRYVTAFAVSGFWNLCEQRKPFTPILGETYQGYWPDGTAIFIDHIRHHPPISRFFVRKIFN